jgi:hypothetical protein
MSVRFFVHLINIKHRKKKQYCRSHVIHMIGYRLFFCLDDRVRSRSIRHKINLAIIICLFISSRT